MGRIDRQRCLPHDAKPYSGEGNGESEASSISRITYRNTFRFSSDWRRSTRLVSPHNRWQAVLIEDCGRAVLLTISFCVRGASAARSTRKTISQVGGTESNSRGRMSRSSDMCYVNHALAKMWRGLDPCWPTLNQQSRVWSPFVG